MSIFERIVEETESISVSDTRSPFEIFAYITSEYGEFAEELAIQCGSSYKKSKEGAVVEAIDVIIGLVYLIKRLDPDLKESAIVDIIKFKVSKWKYYLNEQGEANEHGR